MLEMLEKGETPPNIRTDIVDEPPNPAAVPSSARMKPKAKPWERAAAPTSAPFPALAPSGSSGIMPHYLLLCSLRQKYTCLWSAPACAWC